MVVTIIRTADRRTDGHSRSNGVQLDETTSRNYNIDIDHSRRNVNVRSCDNFRCETSVMQWNFRSQDSKEGKSKI